MKAITYGSVCSGIEAASVAWHPLGFIPTWFSEIEPFPKAVLAHRFPHVADLGDMTKLAEQVRRGVVHAPTILVGGTPCQAFSVAGLREGLSDPRGGLTIKYVELLDAIDDARILRGKHPAICCWENVPGVLSDKGNAFGCFLAALAGEDGELVPAGGKWTDAGCVYGPQRAVAWRVLDAQYFGLAQRRRRVFVVASARDGFDPAAVLFESEGLRRDHPPRRGEGEATAGTLASRTTGGGFPGTDEACSGYLQPVGFEITGPVTACGGTAKKHGFGWGQQEWENGFAVPVCVHGTQDPDVRHDQAHTLGRNSGQENAVLSVALRGRDGGATAELGDEVAGCLRASTGGGDKAHVLAPTTFAIQAGALRTNPASGPDGVGVQADHAYTLEARAEVQAVAVAFQPGNLSRGAGAAPSTDIFPTLKADHGRGMSDQDPHVMAGSAVRRLTPRECERLQGFPDDWTLIPWRGKPAADCPDGPRYKAIGNSKAVPVVRWIGKRILAQLNT